MATTGGLERIDLGADLRVRRGDGEPIVLRPRRSYFPARDAGAGAVSRYFDGEATSEVGLDLGLRRDLWTVVSPDIATLLEISRRGDKVFADASALDEGVRSAALGQALQALVTRYRDDAPPATFRVLVSPLVTWIWVGALVVIAGGLIAVWPAPARAPQRVRAGYAARVARELGRA